MATKHEIYWYKAYPSVAKAFLYNCRDRDLREGDGIPAGSVILGIYGFCVAEKRVPELEGHVVPFQPNRRCEWLGHELRCMVHPNMPVGAKTKAQLKPYNYLVAELETADQVELAQENGVPVVLSTDGKSLINLECTTFQAQGVASPRRVKMI